MAKMVGYACSIKLQWLNKAVDLLSENLNDAEYKKALNDYLAFEIDGETRLRKTREILMRMWFYEDERLLRPRERGLALIREDSDNAPLVHLCLTYLAYPVVSDICKYMGKLFEFQDEITTPMLKQKLYDEWGERGTLESTARRVTLTLKELGFLVNESRTRYKVQKTVVKNAAAIDYLITTAMTIDGSSYFPFSSLTEFPFLFPFSYKVTKEQLMENEDYTLATFDSTLSVSLKAPDFR